MQMVVHVCAGGAAQAQEEVSAQLLLMKTMLYGVGDQEPQTEVTAQLAQEVYNHDILNLLINNLTKVDFEVSLPPGIYSYFGELF